MQRGITPLALVILLAVLIGGGYVAYKKKDWKTYRNEQYGFELKYRAGALAEEHPDGVALVSFHFPGSSLGTKLYVHEADYPTFDSLIADEKGKIIGEAAAYSNSHYNFNLKKINGTDIFFVWTDFGGFDGISEEYIWLKDNHYLLVSDAGDINIESFKFTK